MKRTMTLIMLAALISGLFFSPLGATSAAAKPKLSEALATAAKENPGTDVNILITTTNHKYGQIVKKINNLGGSVSNRFKYANGLAATVPVSALLQLSDIKNVEGISLDGMRYPGPEGGYNIQSAGGASLEGTKDLDAFSSAAAAFTMDGGFDTLTLSGDQLETYYSFETDSMNTGSVFDTGNWGQDSLVVVIDTGSYADHFMLAGSVVGGVDLSTDAGTGFEGYSRVDNHYHGTHVAGIISGNGAILIPDTDILARSYELYTGSPLPDFAPGLVIMPLLGTAPAADIYAVKVFDHNGGSAPSSTIIAGIEHAIDLKVSGAYDVDVINMSLGGGTGYEGFDLESQAVDAATAAGITVVVSAGNDGPASQTIGSPAGANTAITVGAVAHPVNTRLFWDINYNFFGIGSFLYVDNNPQMVYFSSRGPTSDGRDKPTASAVGAFVLSASTGSTSALTWASGTSMSSPAMAGIVALLNTHSEMNVLGASPYDYKEAVIAGSHMLPGFEAYEQGAGFINAEDALNALIADNSYGDAHPTLKKGHSARSVKPYGTKLGDINDGPVTFEIKDLAPGYVEDYYFKLHPNAEQIIVEFSNVDYGEDPWGFNSFEVHLMSAMRTTDSGYYLYSVNVWGDAVLSAESLNSTATGYVFGVNATDLPLMDGNVRLSIENDWTSFDDISGTVTVTVVHGNNSDQPDEAYHGKLANGEEYGFFPVGFGPNGVELELNWKHDWRAVPAADMDLIVAWFDTDGALHWEYGAASFSSPEILHIDADNIDAVFVLISAYETYGETEPWTLEVRYK